MLTDRGEFDMEATPLWIRPTRRAFEDDPRCEWCGRSIVTRFGEERAPASCDSCEDDWRREYEASGGRLEVVEDE